MSQRSHVLVPWGRRLAQITEAYARTGQGLEADHRRALAELRGRQQSIWAATGQLKVASANLVRPLVLSPNIVVAPVEPAEAVVRLVPDDIPLDCLIVNDLVRVQVQVAADVVTACETRAAAAAQMAKRSNSSPSPSSHSS